jgi:hypothetical protein
MILQGLGHPRFSGLRVLPSHLGTLVPRASAGLYAQQQYSLETSGKVKNRPSGERMGGSVDHGKGASLG